MLSIFLLFPAGHNKVHTLSLGELVEFNAPSDWLLKFKDRLPSAVIHYKTFVGKAALVEMLGDAERDKDGSNLAILHLFRLPWVGINTEQETNMQEQFPERIIS